MPAIRAERLDLRSSANVKRTLRSAAAAQGRSLSEFVLQSALERAHEVLADRRVFGLDGEGWVRFHEALNAPKRETPRLDRLMSEPGVFGNG